jgi:predicted DNA-binding transcriptional regulator YafY
LDAWCHLRAGLRTFALDAIEAASSLDVDAVEVSERQLEEHFADSYGIFAGRAERTAILKFTPQRARWVARERWHAVQEGRMLDDGSYELRLPYSNPAELIMDILKYGPDVEVTSPQELRQAVATRLQQAAARYA